MTLEHCKAEMKAAFEAFKADKSEGKYNDAVAAKKKYLDCVKFMEVSYEKLLKGIPDDVVEELEL